MENAIGLSEEQISGLENVERAIKTASIVVKWIGVKSMNVVKVLFDIMFSRSPAQEYLDEVRLKYQSLRPL